MTNNRKHIGKVPIDAKTGKDARPKKSRFSEFDEEKTPSFFKCEHCKSSFWTMLGFGIFLLLAISGAGLCVLLVAGACL